MNHFCSTLIVFLLNDLVFIDFGKMLELNYHKMIFYGSFQQKQVFHKAHFVKNLVEKLYFCLVMLQLHFNGRFLSILSTKAIRYFFGETT